MAHGTVDLKLTFTVKHSWGFKRLTPPISIYFLEVGFCQHINMDFWKSCKRNWTWLAHPVWWVPEVDPASQAEGADTRPHFSGAASPPAPMKPGKQGIPIPGPPGSAEKLVTHSSSGSCPCTLKSVGLRWGPDLHFQQIPYHYGNTGLKTSPPSGVVVASSGCSLRLPGSSEISWCPGCAPDQCCQNFISV